jgi:hypothetical protein
MIIAHAKITTFFIFIADGEADAVLLSQETSRDFRKVVTQPMQLRLGWSSVVMCSILDVE